MARAVTSSGIASPPRWLQAVCYLLVLTTAKSEDPWDVLVIGAGISGLTAARDLQANGYKVSTSTGCRLRWSVGSASALLTKINHMQVLVLEARDRLGGRVWSRTINSNKSVVDFGASWIHGINGNPLYTIVKDNNIVTLPTNYDSETDYFKGKELSDAQVRPTTAGVGAGGWLTRLAAPMAPPSRTSVHILPREYRLDPSGALRASACHNAASCCNSDRAAAEPAGPARMTWPGHASLATAVPACVHRLPHNSRYTRSPLVAPPVAAGPEQAHLRRPPLCCSPLCVGSPLS
jgi:hypothetical protein